MAEASLLWPFVAMSVAAVATYVWRALGVALSGRIDPESPLFEWVACVSYALLAGLIARMIVFPLGPLADTDLAARVASAAIALAIFFATRRNLALGVIAGAGALVLMTWAARAGL